MSRTITSIFIVAAIAFTATSCGDKTPVFPVVFGPELSEFPTGFDLTTNGHVPQDRFEEAREGFEEVEEPEDGLGPIFNAPSCAACHSVPASGGSSAVTETVAGTLKNGVFTAPTGGPVIQAQATDERIKENLGLFPHNVEGLRGSPSLFGLGAVEAIPDEVFKSVSAWQRAVTSGKIVGTVVPARLIEVSNQ